MPVTREQTRDASRAACLEALVKSDTPRTPSTRRAVPSRALAFVALGLATIGVVWFALRGNDASAPDVAPIVRTEEVVAVTPDEPGPVERSAPEIEPTPRDRQPHYPPARATIPEETIWGHVVDAVSKEPIDFFHTYFAPVEEGPIDQLAQRQDYIRLWGNSKGAFTLRELARGKYGLLIRRDGYRDVVFPELEIPNQKGKLQIEMQRGAYIEVSVVDGEDLDGIGGIEVLLKPISLDDPVAKLPTVMMRETDDFGKGLFTGLPAGTWNVSLINAQLSAQPEYQMYVGAEAAVPVRFVVQPLNDVIVTVKDGKGEALNAVHVRMWTKGGQGTFRDDTDIDGEAYLSHVPAGTYTVKIWKHGFYRDDREITITSNHGETRLDFVMLEAPADAELNPTLEQIQQLKTPGVKPSDVFKKKP
jgi:Carboxypeptidase regulatory-like domain